MEAASSTPEELALRAYAWEAPLRARLQACWVQWAAQVGLPVHVWGEGEACVGTHQLCVVHAVGASELLEAAQLEAGRRRDTPLLLVGERLWRAQDDVLFGYSVSAEGGVSPWSPLTADVAALVTAWCATAQQHRVLPRGEPWGPP